MTIRLPPGWTPLTPHEGLQAKEPPPAATQGGTPASSTGQPQQLRRDKMPAFVARLGVPQKRQNAQAQAAALKDFGWADHDSEDHLAVNAGTARFMKNPVRHPASFVHDGPALAWTASAKGLALQVITSESDGEVDVRRLEEAGRLPKSEPSSNRSIAPQGHAERLLARLTNDHALRHLLNSIC